MEHSFFSLHRHPDVSKLEFEDCVLRQAAPALLSKECDIAQVMVDVCTERPQSHKSRPSMMNPTTPPASGALSAHPKRVQRQKTRATGEATHNLPWRPFFLVP